ncbi:hypothetical protein FB45DRAFT_1125261 [Roridomyces roridus]|uniref:F-box domain-containing protein n=1 Tax=Roridomyces roridus TaxID=1738132 RepID=A0AAD7FSV9_9AGAR|nr:hypothetical protein FB45DRAFT_1125261 [Roridomyces roridus]
MYVTEIQTRIDQVSLDIEQQKEVLKELERRKSALQRQLNDVRDPIARLPLEISSDILLECGLQDPTLLMNVCKRWFEIVESTPALWAEIRIEYPCPEGCRRRLDTWLQRAASHPLHLTLPGSIDKDILALFQKHSEQVKHLIILHQQRLPAQYHGYADTLLELGHWDPVSKLSSLRMLELCRRGGALECSSDLILGLLSRTPNLVELVMDQIQIVGWHAENASRVLLPKLRTTTYRQHLGDEILQMITAPRMETLGLPVQNIDTERLFSFIQSHRTPPIRDLVIAGLTSFQSIYTSLALLTTLTHLETSRNYVAVLHPLFNRLLFYPASGLCHSISSISFAFEDWIPVLRDLPARCASRPHMHTKLFISSLRIGPDDLAALKNYPSPVMVYVFIISVGDPQNILSIE